MSVSWSISPHHRLVLWHFDGSLTFDAITGTAAVLAEHKDYRPDFDELAIVGKNCDLSTLDFKSIGQILKGDIQILSRDTSSVDIKIVVVSNRPINQCFLEFFTMYTDDYSDYGGTMVLCKSIEQAAKLLRRNLNDLRDLTFSLEEMVTLEVLCK